MISMRVANLGDALSVCNVLRTSITELCGDDHSEKPALLASWLANKTEETITKWIVQPRSKFLVALENEAIIGVGAALDIGEITLLYVSPTARFRGVSKTILIELENHLHGIGLHEVFLYSTRTAHRFYLSMGYCDIGESQIDGGLYSQHMIKYDNI